MLTIIAGSRNARERDVIYGIESCPWSDQITKVISGTAWGADKWGESYAERKGLEVLKFPAEWDIYGMSAGPRRNKEMAENSDSLIAIWDGYSRGTSTMLNYANKYNLRTFVYYYNENRFEERNSPRRNIQFQLFENQTGELNYAKA